MTSHERKSLYREDRVNEWPRELYVSEGSLKREPMFKPVLITNQIPTSDKDKRINKRITKRITTIPLPLNEEVD